MKQTKKEKQEEIVDLFARAEAYRYAASLVRSDYYIDGIYVHKHLSELSEMYFTKAQETL